MKRSIWIGYDRREAKAFAVARSSVLRRLSEPITVNTLLLRELQERGLYSRPMDERDGRLIDILSIRDDYDGSISTEHANARFCVPHLAREGWALFMDGDMLVRGDMAKVFQALDPAKAIYCVQHRHAPVNDHKMDGQLQTCYRRKNWSSFMIFNCDHPANRALSLAVVNTWPGRDLHAFNWLGDGDIGELDVSWNFLVGHNDPNVVHFTEGTPDMPGYEGVLFADEWRKEEAISGQP